MIKKLLFSYIILLSALSIAQEVQLSNSAQISVLTCSAGNESYSLYGHTSKISMLFTIMEPLISILQISF